MTLRLSDSATLKAIPNAAKKYAVITISNASQVWVIGGTLEGDRDQHQGKSGEWGMGIHIGKRAEHITISGVASKKMWGDGFYVSGADDVGSARSRPTPIVARDYRSSKRTGCWS